MRARRSLTVGFGAAAALAMAAAMVAPAYAADAPRLITTVAGTGGSGSSGNGGPATSAEVGFPEATAVDAAGNLYIASRNEIRKVDSQGIITTVAGDGSDTCSSGEGVPATNTGVCASGLDIDAAGNLYFADYFGTRRVYRVGTDGILTAVAGTGEFGFSGDGGPATDARVIAIDVTVDAAGNLYLSDFLNNRIRKVDTAGIITTVAGTGEYGALGDSEPATGAQLASPIGVVTDTAGNLYIADTGNDRVRKVDTAGIITMFVGVHSAAARLDYPKGLDVDAAGNLYIADFGNNRVVRADPGGHATVLAGDISGYAGDGGPATEAQLNNPYDVAVVSPDLLYVADFANHRVRRIEVVPPPAAAADTYRGCLLPLSSVAVPAPGVVANDVPAGLTVTAYTQPSRGRVTVNPDGSFTYRNTQLVTVSAQTFSYTVSDHFGQTSSATVTISPSLAPLCR